MISVAHDVVMDITVGRQVIAVTDVYEAGKNVAG